MSVLCKLSSKYYTTLAMQSSELDVPNYAIAKLRVRALLKVAWGSDAFRYSLALVFPSFRD